MVVTFFIFGLILILLGIFIIIKKSLIAGISKLSLRTTLSGEEKNPVAEILEKFSILLDKIPKKFVVAIVLIVLGAVICAFCILSSPEGKPILEKIPNVDIKLQNKGN
jgi:hypothetical protein